MPCSINFSMTLQTEVLSTVTSDFLKQKISIKSHNSMFCVSLYGNPKTLKHQKKKTTKLTSAKFHKNVSPKLYIIIIFIENSKTRGQTALI